ncbi:hypothetical protein [Pseudoxanthomonas wuyuanensis]
MSIAISIVSAAIAILSLTFAIYSWRQANRPLVSARITAFSGGSNAIALNIVVENTGNRPAKDIHLIAKEPDVLAALSTSSEIPKDAERCFFSNISIPLLIHGRSTSNAFGHLGYPVGSWRAGAEIPIKVVYRDLGLRRYSSKLRLLLADDAGFAQTFWGDAGRRDG